MESAPPEAVSEDALLIVCGELPTKLARTTVVVNPPQGQLAGITVGDEAPAESAQISVASSGADEILRNVNVADMSVSKCRPLDLPPAATPLLRCRQQVIAAMLDTPRARVIVLSFDPEADRWPLTPSFVVFWANVLADGQRRSDAGGMQFHKTGDVVEIPAGEQGIRLRTPSGLVALSPGPNGWASVVLDRVGIYVVEGTSRSFAVNLLNERASRTSVADLRMDNDALPVPRWRAGTTSLAPWFCILAACLAVLWWQLRR
ncbi:MAG TPA: hypothetical protein VMX57_09085 [Planctomycetota bacterium]|nr:hypothetical protein [Planctomycetota bacterium]